MSATEVVNVSPDDWFEVRIINPRAVQKTRLIFGELNDGSSIVVPAVTVKSAPGQHICHPYVKSGDIISCRIEASRKGSCLYAAIETWIDGEFTEGTAEHGVITKWLDTGCGTIKRPCGCRIFALSGEMFNVGDEVQFHVYRDRTNRSGWIAAKLELTQSNTNFYDGDYAEQEH